MSDYFASDFKGAGRYRVYYQRLSAPIGPFGDEADELYDYNEYPSDGYIVDVDEHGGVTNVPSLPGRPTYNDVMEAVKTRYQERITAFLNRIRELLINDGRDVTEVAFMDGDYYSWSVATTIDGEVKDGSVDFTVEQVEERHHEGGEGYGVTFGLNITGWGGLILGGFQPYNYTPDWVVDARDDDAVEARFKLLEDVDIDGILDLLVGANV